MLFLILKMSQHSIIYYCAETIETGQTCIVKQTVNKSIGILHVAFTRIWFDLT